MTQLALRFPPPFTSAQLAAAETLAKMVAANRASFATQDYRRRRAAALKGWGR